MLQDQIAGLNWHVAQQAKCGSISFARAFAKVQNNQYPA
jgi:hypothetical protein